MCGTSEVTKSTLRGGAVDPGTCAVPRASPYGPSSDSVGAVPGQVPAGQAALRVSKAPERQSTSAGPPPLQESEPAAATWTEATPLVSREPGEARTRPAAAA